MVGEAGNIEEAIRVIRTQKPDLVFLDLQLNDQEGWELLDYFKTIDFEVIVTTAHDEHALRSYDYGVGGYVMKPLTPGSLNKAIARVEKRFSWNIVPSAPPAESPELKIQTSNGHRYIPVDRIVRFEAARNYSWIFIQDEAPILLSKTLSTFEEQVEPYSFLRIHHSHLVNLAFIEMYERQKDLVVLPDGTSLPVSREKKKLVKEHLARK